MIEQMNSLSRLESMKSKPQVKKWASGWAPLPSGRGSTDTNKLLREKEVPFSHHALADAVLNKMIEPSSAGSKQVVLMSGRGFERRGKIYNSRCQLIRHIWIVILGSIAMQWHHQLSPLCDFSPKTLRCSVPTLKKQNGYIRVESNNERMTEVVDISGWGWKGESGKAEGDDWWGENEGLKAHGVMRSKSKHSWSKGRKVTRNK